MCVCVCTCERLIGVLMYVPLACVFILLLVFCGQTFKIVNIFFCVCGYKYFALVNSLNRNVTKKIYNWKR